MAYRLTRKAAEDIADIYREGNHQFAPRQADAYHNLLEKTFRFLAENPLALRKREELSPAVRIHPVQSHLVIYQLDDDGDILVIRIRHTHEDWAEGQT